MVDFEPDLLELSPSLGERLRKSLVAIIGLIIGIIGIVGAVLVDFLSDVVFFIAVFCGAICLFFSAWRIFRFVATRLYIDSEKILYRDRFAWKEINWADVISVGQANEIGIKDENVVLKKIKALLFMTESGLRKFDMTCYSTNHGQEIVEKIMESRPKFDEIEDEEIEE
jgi:hypothetical protein